GVLYASYLSFGQVFLSAFDAATGAPLWSLGYRFAWFTSVSAPVVYDGVIYLAMSYSPDGQSSFLAVVSVSATTHSLIWSDMPLVFAKYPRLAVSYGTIAIAASVPDKSDKENPFGKESITSYRTNGAFLSTITLKYDWGAVPAILGNRTYYAGSDE